jgi:hypothetical protein
MVLVEWIVPEPDPNLHIGVEDIDIYKLNYHDIKYICSSTMKQHFDEFRRLPNFINYADSVVKRYNEESPIKRYNISRTPIKPVTPPFKRFTPPLIHNLEPVNTGENQYKNILEQYQKYLVSKNMKSDVCIIH